MRKGSAIAEIAAGAKPGAVGGVRLIPAHCHPDFSSRVERYRRVRFSFPSFRFHPDHSL